MGTDVQARKLCWDRCMCMTLLLRNFDEGDDITLLASRKDWNSYS